MITIVFFSLSSFIGIEKNDSLSHNIIPNIEKSIFSENDSINIFYNKSDVKNMVCLGHDTVKEKRWFYYYSGDRSVKNSTKEKLKTLCKEKGGNAVYVCDEHSYGFGFFTVRTIIGKIYKKPLTQKEKLSDFEYLYKELEQSYPYFNINMRMNNIGWLAQKETYLKKIRDTKNDKEFYIAINDILGDLNNGHTDTYPTEIYDYFYKVYKAASQNNPSLIPYLKELEKTNSEKCNYWKALWNEYLSEKKSNSNVSNNSSNVESENISTTFIDSLSVGVLSVRSFSYDLMGNDGRLLKDFLEKIYKYDNLIIDIQGNEGGATEYWMNNMIPYLIKDTISFPVYYAFKNSDKLKYFTPQYFINTIKYADIDLPNTPPELENGDYLFRTEKLSIYPKSNKKYLGKIYLLVDGEVFSSAEALAYFCKSTKFATVVGERTSGDGVGTDPLLLTLPNSGIVIRYTGEMGLNPDGSANDETKTIPDILINAESNNSRLNKLLKHISESK